MRGKVDEHRDNSTEQLLATIVRFGRDELASQADGPLHRLCRVIARHDPDLSKQTKREETDHLGQVFRARVVSDRWRYSRALNRGRWIDRAPLLRWFRPARRPLEAHRAWKQAAQPAERCGPTVAYTVIHSHT